MSRSQVLRVHAAPGAPGNQLGSDAIRLNESRSISITGTTRSDSFALADSAVVQSVGAGPSGRVYGLMSRRPPSTAEINQGMMTKIKGFVHEMTWNSAQSTEGASNAISTTALNSLQDSVDLANTHSIPGLRLRIFAGKDAPTWAKNLGAGPVTGWVNTDVNGGTYTIPLWWDPAYLAAYDNFIEVLAAALVDFPLVKDITISGGTTIFAEPCIKQFSNSTNRTTIQGFGYNQTTEFNSQKSCIDSHHTHMSPRGIASTFAYNPYQLIGSGGGIQISNPKTLELMDYQRTAMGRFCIWQNNSCNGYLHTDGTYHSQRGESDAKYAEIYNYMLTEGFPDVAVNFQTETLTKMIDDNCTPEETAQWVIKTEKGFAVEMPAGWVPTGSGSDPHLYVTQSQANSINAEMLARKNAL